MSPTNQRRGGQRAVPVGTTHEGTPGHQADAPTALRRAVASYLLWNDQFYENGVQVGNRIQSLVMQVEPEQAAAIAIEARNKYKIRHAGLLIAVTMARSPFYRKQLAQLLPQIIKRPDELTEFMALYWSEGKISIAAQAKRGLRAAFEQFSPYQLAKYRSDDKAITLRDVMFLTHPKPSQDDMWATDRMNTYKKLADQELTAPDTWERELSAGTNKRETWERLLAGNKLGALALLRNLRNMQTAQVDESLLREKILAMNTEWVLPFRFLTAVKYAPKLAAELENVMLRCLAGQPKLPGRTALVVDTSPSMWHTRVSAKSEMDRFEAAAALAILCEAICEDARVYTFNERAHRIPPGYRGFALRDAMHRTKGGYSRGGLGVEMAQQDGYDRLIVLTDGQWHASRGERVQDAVDMCPDPGTEKAYMINVAGYRNAVGEKGKWVQVEGWSEGVIEYIRALEGGESALGAEAMEQEAEAL